MKGIQAKASKKKATANKVTDITTKRGRGRPRKPAPDEQESVSDFRRDPLTFQEDDSVIPGLEDQPELPTMETEAIPELERKAKLFAKADTEAKNATKRKKSAKGVLIVSMIEHSIKHYKKHGVTIDLDEDWKVSVEID